MPRISPSVAMSLDGSVLARVDRRLHAELDHGEGMQLVKVPVSDAVWSTWRRLCDVAGVSMGRGLALLLHQELAGIVDVQFDGVVDALAGHEAAVSVRETALEEREAEMSRRERAVAVRERELAAAESTAATQSIAVSSKPGRNQPCPCGSKKKFKYCHGNPTI